MENTKINALMDCLLDMKLGTKTESDFMSLLGGNPDQISLDHFASGSSSLDEILNKASDATGNVVNKSIDKLIDAIVGSATLPKHSLVIERIHNNTSKLELSTILGFILPKNGITRPIHTDLESREGSIFISEILLNYHDRNLVKISLSKKIATSKGIQLKDVDEEMNKIEKHWLEIRQEYPVFKNYTVQELYRIQMHLLGGFPLSLYTQSAKVRSVIALGRENVTPDSPEGQEVIKKAFYNGLRTFIHHSNILGALEPEDLFVI